VSCLPRRSRAIFQALARQISRRSRATFNGVDATPSDSCSLREQKIEINVNIKFKGAGDGCR